jgi:hypothetical protein
MKMRRSTMVPLDAGSDPKPFGFEFLGGPPPRTSVSAAQIEHDRRLAQAVAGAPFHGVDVVSLNLSPCLGRRHCVKDDAYIEALAAVSARYRLFLEIPEDAKARAFDEARGIGSSVGATLVLDDCFGRRTHPAQHVMAAGIQWAKLDGHLMAKARTCGEQALRFFRTALSRLLEMYEHVVVEGIEFKFDVGLVADVAAGRPVYLQGWLVDRMFGIYDDPRVRASAEANDGDVAASS